MMNIISNLDKLIQIYKGFTIPGYPKLKDELNAKLQIGVASLVTHFYKRNHDKDYAKKNANTQDFSIEMQETDYELVCDSTKVPFVEKKRESENISSLEHDTMLASLFKSAILSRNGYSIITFNEVFVGDRDLLVERADCNSHYTPIGLIDFICVNTKGELVIGEVKSSINYYEGLTKERMFLKQDTARQLHMYGALLNFMAKKNSIDLKVSHYLLLGYEAPRKVNSIDHTYSLWKVKNNPDKWIHAISEKELSFLPIKFKDRATDIDANLTPRFKVIAHIGESLSGSQNVNLIHDRLTTTTKKYFLYDSDRKLILKKFDKFTDANDWLGQANLVKIELLYKSGEVELKMISDF
jgi:hypothetical protein